jgi:hypothetical protein
MCTIFFKIEKDLIINDNKKIKNVKNEEIDAKQYLNMVQIG